MAAAIRSMLAKSGNRISSVVNLGYSSRHPLESYFPAEIPERLYGGFFSRSSRDCIRVMINTHFALEEFNKQKNRQLQFVKLVRAYNQWTGGGAWQCHLLTIEAIDAGNVVKTYQALVVEHFPSKPPDPQLLLFGLVADNGNGSLVKLIDNRPACRGGLIDNRWVGREDIKLQRKKKIEPCGG
ncbi:hypothetical protein ACLB2K_039386 [Fragaria x ananassa]